MGRAIHLRPSTAWGRLIACHFRCDVLTASPWLRRQYLSERLSSTAVEREVARYGKIGRRVSILRVDSGRDLLPAFFDICAAHAFFSRLVGGSSVLALAVACPAPGERWSSARRDGCDPMTHLPGRTAAGYTNCRHTVLRCT